MRFEILLLLIFYNEHLFVKGENIFRFLFGKSDAEVNNNLSRAKRQATTVCVEILFKIQNNSVFASWALDLIKSKIVMIRLGSDHLLHSKLPIWMGNRFKTKSEI